jgi:hypothetical protein
MAIPAPATGGGNNSTARNVCRFLFSEALSTAPRYEMYDGGTFPAVGSATTTNNAVFAGTAGNSNKPMTSLVDTSSGAPSSAWMPASATAGSANPNRMKGTTNYVTATATPGAGGTITFNMVQEIPSDHDTTAQAVDLLVRHTYTGAAPTLTPAINEGSEGSPSWTALTIGTHGFRHTRAGVVAGGPYLANVPLVSVEVTGMIWATV